MARKKKRGPGRPPGSGKKRGPGRPKGSGKKRGPGRPPKSEKRGPGRPPGSGKKRGRPRKERHPELEPTARKKRGRPPAGKFSPKKFKKALKKWKKINNRMLKLREEYEALRPIEAKLYKKYQKHKALKDAHEEVEA